MTKIIINKNSEELFNASMQDIDADITLKDKIHSFKDSIIKSVTINLSEESTLNATQFDEIFDIRKNKNIESFIVELR